jgi:hypothetical protein
MYRPEFGGYWRRADREVWDLKVPSVAIVDGLPDGIAEMVRQLARDDMWTILECASVADALAATAYTNYGGGIATAVVDVSMMGQWRGRQNAPYEILFMNFDQDVKESRVAFSYLGGSKNGGFSVMSYSPSCAAIEIEEWIQAHLREEDPRRKWSDSLFGEGQSPNTRDVRYFSISIASGEGSEVAFKVDSLDGRPGGFARSIELWALDFDGAKIRESRQQINLLPTRSLDFNPEYDDRPEDDELDGPSSFRVVEWRSDPIALRPGLWKARVEGGGWNVRLTAEIDFTLPVAAENRVFISYVHEDSSTVLNLAGRLEGAGYAVWLDKSSLTGGQRWKGAIRDAIRVGTAFIACFSHNYAARERSHMTEELNLAREEIRMRPSNRAWFIPIRLGECEIPDLPIGGGETLRDIQHLDMFPDFDRGVATVIRALGKNR